MKRSSLSRRSCGFLVSPWSITFSLAPTYAQSPSGLGQRIGFPRKAAKVLDSSGMLAAYKIMDSFVPLLEYSPLVWDGAAASHISRLDRVQHLALSLVGPGVIVDSLSIQCQVSGLCYLFKLTVGHRVPALINCSLSCLFLLSYNKS